MSLARTTDGWCGFRQDQRCSLQQAGGENMLPSACRHFPRVFLRDGRGTMVTLSHYCPTAAALLLEDDRPATVVDAAAPLALSEPIEGLDARDALPPLVRPGLLADLEGFAAWEEAALAEFAAAPSADVALDRIAAATEQIRQWTPQRGRLVTAVSSAFAAETSSRSGDDRLSEGFGAVREVTGPHPLLDVDADFASDWTTLQSQSGDVLQRPIANYMAACTFGNWTAYRGQGLRTVVAWLRGCYDVVRVQLVRHARAAGGINREVMIESFRMADFIIVHTVPSLEFGRTAAVFEHVAPKLRPQL